MAGTTDFLQWNPAAINQETDAQYLADSQRSGGAVDDTPFPALLGNKVFYQLSTFIAAFAGMLASKGFTTSDADINVLQAVLSHVLTTADQAPAIMAVGYSPTPVFDASQASGFQMTLSGNVAASTIVGVLPGQLLAFYFLQDGVGGRTVAWPASFVGAIQPDPAPGAFSLMLFRADLASIPHAAGPLVSTNGVFAGSFTLTAPGTAGQVLTNVGGFFVPRDPAPTTAVVNDVSGTRATNTTYQNTSGKTMRVYGSCTTSGSSTGELAFFIGSASPTTELWTNENTASVAGKKAGFVGEVPNGWYYALASSGDITGVNRWVEILS